MSCKDEDNTQCDCSSCIQSEPVHRESSVTQNPHLQPSQIARFIQLLLDACIEFSVDFNYNLCPVISIKTNGGEIEVPFDEKGNLCCFNSYVDEEEENDKPFDEDTVYEYGNDMASEEFNK